MGIYSAVLGFFIPSGGGKWLIEAPYVMQAANDLKVHLGWAVQDLQRRRGAAQPGQSVLDAADARRARPQGARHRRLHLPAAHRACPVVLFLLWPLGRHPDLHPPVIP